LNLPRSRLEIARLQSERKRGAVERALQSPFWKNRLLPSQRAIDETPSPASDRSN